MIKTIISGCNGRMGQTLTKIINERDDMKVAAGFTRKAVSSVDFPVFSSPGDCNVESDVVIDFSNHTIIPSLLNYCVKNNTPIVTGTTALDEKCQSALNEAAETIPVFQSANMSLGINALMKVIKEITPVLEDEFSVEIIEMHHKTKVDSPSGTALLLADTVSEASKSKREYIYGRHSKHDEFNMDAIGIHAVRGGTVPGTHLVLFSGPDEMIELKHQIITRDVFAYGALAAAQFIIKQKPGRYTMSDLLDR